MTMKSKSYTAIDIAKYISALLVVYIHTFRLADISADLNMIVLQAVCRAVLLHRQRLFVLPAHRCAGRLAR